ncbi:uncharacterized protein LOC142159963 [Mixophyes fleayi]|uniref:uncharacterized protein LOC142159963 n=1 Tax=Mixophyes fleayi TaxID=3061075 RepID=UPI003F4D8B50
MPQINNFQYKKEDHSINKQDPQGEVQRDLKVEEETKAAITMDGFSNRNTQEGCPSQIYSLDSTEEHTKYIKEESLNNMKFVIGPEKERNENICSKIKEEIPTIIKTVFDSSNQNSFQASSSITPTVQVEVYITETADAEESQLVYTKVKEHTCSDCGKCFAQRGSLIRHQLTHTGEKPFICSECGNCYTTNANLARHKRTHTRENQFICSECRKGFITKSHLIKHQKSHTKVKLFACSECGLQYKYISHLAKHQTIHTTEKSSNFFESV